MIQPIQQIQPIVQQQTFTQPIYQPSFTEVVAKQQTFASALGMWYNALTTQ